MDGLEVGSIVLYTTPTGVDLGALVVHVWSPTVINLAYVSPDETQEDQCGRIVLRETSISHASVMTGVPGRYWRRPGEERREDSAPGQPT